MADGIRRVTNDHIDGRILLPLNGGVVFAENVEVRNIAVFVDLECIGKRDIHKRHVVWNRFTVALRGFLTQGVISGLDIDGGDVVGQQHDFCGKKLVGIFACHIFWFDEPRLQQAHHERRGPGEGVKDTHAFIAEPFAKVLAGDLIGSTQDKVHDFHRGVDNAQGFCLFLESLTEEALIQILNHLLLTRSRGHLRSTNAHGLVELFQRFRFSVQVRIL